MSVKLDIEILVPSQWYEQPPPNCCKESRDDAGHRSERPGMRDPDASLIALLATLNDGARPCYRRALVARRHLRILQSLVEALHPPEIVDPVFFGVMDGVVGHSQAFSKQAAELLAGMWLGDAACCSQGSVSYLKSYKCVHVPKG